MDKKTIQKISKFFAEIGNLSRIKRTGPILAGVKDPENLAEHVVRTAQIAYVLAFLEGANPEKTASMILFHDNAEIRVGDQHKIASRYFNIKQAEMKAFKDQMENLPNRLKKRIIFLVDEFEKRETKESIVAKDADWLEAAIEAKELVEQGHEGMENWIENIKKALETKLAKELLEYIEEQDDFLNSWWKGLKKMTYQRLRR
jgi:putative hydrolase of HD superfamily